jgi:ribosomal protein S12 methylthiotransferase
LTPESYAYVKVAEGCDHRCAYCAIPLIRGNQRSRTPESVEKECVQLLNNGALELNFIAQDTSRYGIDLKPQENLEALLRRCDRLEGDFWLRVLYTHPLHLTDGLLDVLANSRHVVPYLDIPLQHLLAESVVLIAWPIQIESRRRDGEGQGIVHGQLAVLHELVHLVRWMSVVLINYR